MKEGLEALNLLAHSPQTAHFISWKIAQRFVADDPPPALVDRMANTFLSSGGDIKAVLRTLVASPEFNSKKYFRNKVKTPMEFLASAYRTTLTRSVESGRAGEHDAPDGYGALSRASADGLLHYCGPLDEFECAGGSLELRVSTDEWKVRESEVSMRRRWLPWD